MITAEMKQALDDAAHKTLGCPLILHIESNGVQHRWKYVPNPLHVELAQKIVATFLYLSAMERETTIEKLTNFLEAKMEKETEIHYKDAECALHYFGLKPTLEDYARIGDLKKMDRHYHNLGPIWLFELTDIY
jgi:hypothetical protein